MGVLEGGVLDTAGDVNAWWKKAARTGPGPIPVGLEEGQDVVQSGVEATTGMDSDEFAVASARAADTAGDVISTPGEKFGEATEDTAIDKPVADEARKAGETIWDWWVKWPARVAYGTATGADLRGEDPEHATGGHYAPGILETLELIPAGKAVSSAGRLSAKGGKAMLRTGTKSKKAARAADDTVLTRIGRNLNPKKSEVPENLAKPDHLVGGVTGSLKQELLRFYPQSKLTKGALGATGAMGALGLAGSMAFPTNYTKADEFKSYPGAQVVEETNNDNSPLGYWVVLETDGQTHTILSASGQGTTTVEFPTERDPTFDSVSQARDAFTRYSEAVQDGQRELPAVLQDDERPSDKRTWHNTKRVAMLDGGWYLVEQEKRNENKYRYAVAGKNADGALVYVHPGGESKTTPETYPDKAQAMEYYRQWAENKVGPTPDPKKERPSESELTGALSSTSGSLGTIGTAAVGVGAGVAILIALKVML